MLRALSQASDPRWLGELLSEPKYPAELARTSSTSRDALEQLERAADARILWHEDQGTLTVFCNGHSCAVEGPPPVWLEALCAGEVTSVPAAPSPAEDLLLDFLLDNEGLYVD